MQLILSFAHWLEDMSLVRALNICCSLDNSLAILICFTDTHMITYILIRYIHHTVLLNIHSKTFINVFK